ncbi:hypothetical protein STEG23_035521, partial [Scotinomys teguina]
MTVMPLGRDQDCSLKNREPDVLACWFLDPGGWGKAAAVGLYFIFPGICTLSLERVYEPVSYKQLKDLMEAVKTYGVTATYTTALLRRLTVNAMTPTD